MPTPTETSAIIACDHGRDCSQSKILHKISTGQINAERRGARWYIAEDQIPAIAELFPLRAA